MNRGNEYSFDLDGETVHATVDTDSFIHMVRIEYRSRLLAADGYRNEYRSRSDLERYDSEKEMAEAIAKQIYERRHGSQRKVYTKIDTTSKKAKEHKPSKPKAETPPKRDTAVEKGTTDSGSQFDEDGLRMYDLEDGVVIPGRRQKEGRAYA